MPALRESAAPAPARIVGTPVPPVRRGGDGLLASSCVAVVIAVNLAGVGTVPAPLAGAPTAVVDVSGAPAPALHGPVAAPQAVTAADMRPAAFTTDLPDSRARIAIATAMAQIGLPYVWGGDGPTAGDAGFDCSGLTTFAYAAAGVNLPRTAHTQFYAGPHVSPSAALQPGDLVFYGTPARVHHVGRYIGAGRMVNAPRFGKPVQTAYYRWNGDDYLGATRPAATGSSTGLLPYVPPAVDVPDVPDFVAPPAPLPATPLPAPGDPQPSEAESAAAVLAQQAARQPVPGPAVTAAPTAPPTVAPPPTTTRPASPTPSASPTPEPATGPTTLTLGGATVELAMVTDGDNGLPRSAGIWSRPDRPVVRLAAGSPTAEPGSTATITWPDGATSTYTVASTTEVSTVEAAQLVAAAPAGMLVVLAPAGDGRWAVLTAA